MKPVRIPAPAELPPRARRIPCKTAPGTAAARNYLRVRGEYEMPAVSDRKAWELPPRARRIQARVSS